MFLIQIFFITNEYNINIMYFAKRNKNRNNDYYYIYLLLIFSVLFYFIFFHDLKKK